MQQLLRRRGPVRGPSATPIDLAIEARDPRMASDVVFQFLAYRCVSVFSGQGVLQAKETPAFNLPCCIHFAPPCCTEPFSPPY